MKSYIHFLAIINHIMGSMPTIFRSGPYRFFFYSGDCDEPMHIHIERENKIAKFWIDPVRLQRSGGYFYFGKFDHSKIINNNRAMVI